MTVLSNAGFSGKFFGRGMSKAVCATLAGVAFIASAPAMAETPSVAIPTGTVAATTVDAETQAASLDNGDAQFSQLFASWKSLDQGGNSVSGGNPSAPTTSVSTPSRTPLAGARLSSGYGMRTHPITGRRKGHKGIDLAAPTGTPVYATADGTVTMSQRFSSYGLYISINHGAEIETRYAHLSRLLVPEGASVKKGDLIGHVGSTGRSTGPHLHYEVRVDGRAVNPVPYMTETRAQEAFALTSGAGGQGGQN